MSLSGLKLFRGSLLSTDKCEILCKANKAPSALFSACVYSIIFHATVLTYYAPAMTNDLRYSSRSTRPCISIPVFMCYFPHPSSLENMCSPFSTLYSGINFLLNAFWCNPLPQRRTKPMTFVSPWTTCKLVSLNIYNFLALFCFQVCLPLLDHMLHLGKNYISFVFTALSQIQSRTHSRHWKLFAK